MIELKEELKKRIEELKNELDYGYNILDYDNGYISDIINEISDSNVSIYYSDMLEWLKQGCNEDYVNDYVKEFGIDSNDFDLFKVIQGGQYMEIQDTLYKELEETLKLYAYNYILENIEELENFTIDKLEEIELFNYNNFDRLEDIENEIDML